MPSRKRKKIEGQYFIADSFQKNKKEARKKRDTLKSEGYNARILKSNKSEKHLGKYKIFKKKKK